MWCAHRNAFRMFALLLALMIVANFIGARSQLDKLPAVGDTFLLPRSLQEFRVHRRMSTSAYPVRTYVEGKALRVQSNHSQILPIYNQDGTFYMAMRLNKGVNWLNGMPRGKYLINNRLVTIK